jgi:hypothetical protein
MTPDIAEKKAKLLASLAMHTGPQCVFRHWTGRIVYTDALRTWPHRPAPIG